MEIPMTALFDFVDPNMMLQLATQASATRRSGTVADTVRHSLVHTQSPDATIHHAIMAACSHPVKARAKLGEYYMVAYVSIPIQWAPYITPEFAQQWDISFIGPAGTVQRLPPGMLDMKDLLESPIYIGFDWLWLAKSTPPIQQPHYDKIKPKLIECVCAIRALAEEQK
jgi:hypothetical protein